MIVFHGTHSGAIESIQQDGLVAADEGIFLSADPDCAFHFASIVADDQGTSPVVLAVQLPDDAPVRAFELGLYEAIEYAGPVPPEWIIDDEATLMIE